MLAQDTSSFIQFFNSIKEDTQKAAKQLEAKKKEKNNKVNELRRLQDNNQMLVSQINKNIDALLVNYEYKEFLDTVQKTHQPERTEDEGAQGNSKTGRPAQKKSKDTQEAWENDIQMVPKLQPIMEDEQSDYPLRLKEPAELMELFESLEE